MGFKDLLKKAGALFGNTQKNPPAPVQTASAAQPVDTAPRQVVIFGSSLEEEDAFIKKISNKQDYDDSLTGRMKLTDGSNLFQYSKFVRERAVLPYNESASIVILIDPEKDFRDSEKPGAGEKDALAFKISEATNPRRNGKREVYALVNAKDGSQPDLPDHVMDKLYEKGVELIEGNDFKAIKHAINERDGELDDSYSAGPRI